MTEETLVKSLRRVRELLSSQEPLERRLQSVAGIISRELELDLAVISILDVAGFKRIPSKPDLESALPLRIESGQVSLDGEVVKLPLVIQDVEKTRSRTIKNVAITRGLRGFALHGIYRDSTLIGTIECYSKQKSYAFSADDLAVLEALAELTSLGFCYPSRSFQKNQASTLDDARVQYQRLARYGNTVVMFTDENFSIVDVIGSPEKIFGLKAKTLRNDPLIWKKFLNHEDRALLSRKLKKAELSKTEVKAEIRILHQETKERRWMLLRALPLFSSSGALTGWEGFGIDITERKRAEEGYLQESRRVEALLEVSRALQGSLDPESLTFRGIRALVKATGCTCAYGCFMNDQTGLLELVASIGFGEAFIEALPVAFSGPSLLRHVVSTKKSVLIADIKEEPRAIKSLSIMENLRSTIVAPLISDEKVYGVLALFFREGYAFSQQDLELVEAAATQITLALKEAISRTTEKRLVRSLKALYRISHEISKFRTPGEMAESVLPVMLEEFSLKRVWFGIVNDPGTHIVGQGAYGDNVRPELGELQIELGTRHDFFDTALREKQPIVVTMNDTVICSGLEKLLNSLGLEKFVIFPLLSANQVVGVLIVEPESSEQFLLPEVQDLFKNVTNEIATVVVARRYENKLAEAVKMRMAGLLSSGVAHNFNNILQAILGQVALIEMQLPPESKAVEATKEIAVAARRGGALVSQLLSFATPSPRATSPVNLSQFIEQSTDLYDSLIGRTVELQTDLEKSCPEVIADVQNIQQVITNLLANAKDALRTATRPKITITTKKVRVGLKEIDPELPPGIYVRLDIADNGTGMSQESLSRCFEPFFTTKNVDSGTGLGLHGSGLGLSSAYSIIRQHEGTITVHSQPGEGSVFSIYLPVLALRNGSGKYTEPDLMRVVCVGFERGVEPLMVDMFTGLGFAAEVRYDIEQLNGQFDGGFKVIALDMARLGIDALRRVKELAELFQNSLVILFSDDDIRDFSALGKSANVEILNKPPSVWKVSELLKKKGISVPEPATFSADAR